jgi:hypothetical protein
VADLTRFPTCNGRRSGPLGLKISGSRGVALARPRTLIPITGPLCPGKDHINRATVAAGTDQPIAPIKNACCFPVPFSKVRGIWFDLMAAIPAPHNQPHAGRGGIAQRHRRAGRRVLPPLSALRVVSAWLSLAAAHIASVAVATVRVPAPVGSWRGSLSGS